MVSLNPYAQRGGEDFPAGNKRLQDMRVVDCLKEGLQLSFIEQADLVLQGERARGRFANVWNSTVKKSDLNNYGWDVNPWVRVIEFERLEVTE